ncbi:hypothetical protein M758_3G182500 [Ceratodon purpureus]|nr:hypothetical protein M758_3G182500 [Ceratodon purpureus]
MSCVNSTCNCSSFQSLSVDNLIMFSLLQVDAMMKTLFQESRTSIASAYNPLNRTQGGSWTFRLPTSGVKDLGPIRHSTDLREHLLVSHWINSKMFAREGRLYCAEST